MGGRNDRTGTQELTLHLSILGGIVLVLWGVYLANLLLFSRQLINLGIMPRSAVGLRGIVFAPLLHDSPSHLIANTVPLITLGWLTLLRGLREFWLTTALVMLTAGLGTWLLGAPTSVHIGASGVIFGYFGFLLLRGYFERSVGAISLSLLVGLLYGGLIGGVLPGSSGVSWESHLFGFLGGAIAARLLARPRHLS
ncbi:MAG: rhomboid family intramembrane serine protease [Cyanobacteria bacterium Co-bin8]|nr:rhomboid family intramembrane serine protease [Cyanobacteria bacterium Co-bin8]